jgi:hypothetical protein
MELTFHRRLEPAGSYRFLSVRYLHHFCKFASLQAARYKHSMAKPPKTERFGMVVEPEFLEAIDDWRRKQPELPSRAEAIRRLVKLALQSE